MVLGIVCFVLLAAMEGVWGLKSVTINVPEVARSGDTVTLACNYDLESVPLYTIKWYVNEVEFYKYVPKESPPYRAFDTPSVSVDITKSGPVEVTLRGVKRETSGTYKCEVSADAPLFQTDIKTAHMRVVDVPRSPPHLEADPLKVEVGNNVKAICRISASDPPANITWYINNELISEDDEDVRIFPTKYESMDKYTKSSKSRAEILASRRHFSNGLMVVRCVGSVFGAWREGAEVTIKEVAPLMPSVLLSTSSQTHGSEHTSDDDNFDFFGSGHCSNSPQATLLHILLFLPALLRR